METGISVFFLSSQSRSTKEVDVLMRDGIKQGGEGGESPFLGRRRMSLFLFSPCSLNEVPMPSGDPGNPY